MHEKTIFYLEICMKNAWVELSETEIRIKMRTGNRMVLKRNSYEV